MDQVLFRIPFPGVTDGIPIFGFAAMLLTAFVVCTWVACRRAVREGISAERIQDLVIWLFVGGIAGARIVYMVQYQRPWYEFFKIWQGGIVFYGSAVGGVLAFALAYRFILRKYQIPVWKLADLLAPSVALGLCIGRIGCFLNGCCFGHVCDVEWRSVRFPMLTFPGRDMLLQDRAGDQQLPYQTFAGFTLRPGSDLTVAATDPSSGLAGLLRPGDAITAVNGQAVDDVATLTRLLEDWPRGENGLTLTVRRADEAGRASLVDLAYSPRTRGLHPTQIYESVSMFLLFWVLVFFHPLRRHDGQVFTLLMGCYAVHRFLNEMLRDDTSPVAFGLTLSQNGSLLALAIAVALEVWLTRTQKPRREPKPQLQSAV
jgi:phosphatidylglycerol:prolipoprotein diacylglycerol transferase